MKVKLSEGLREAFPYIKIAILEAGNVVNKSFDCRLKEEKRRLERYRSMNYRDVENLDVIKRYNSFFRRHGKVYPIQY